MHIEINLFESKEVTISQIKKEKKRPGDQYDFNDPMFEKLPDEDQYVKIEPVLKDFRIINPLTQNKTPDKKEKSPVSYLDTIYAQQNQIYAKIKENTFNEEDMFSFLMYDLMINHDLQFKKLKSKFLHFDITKFCCEEFLTKIFQNFVYARSKLREQLSKLGSQEETYKDENIVFSDQICDTICKYIDTLCLTRCFESEVIKKRQFKYIPFKKNVYFEVSLLFRVRSKNIKNLGNSISRYTKKNKLGKNNGFSLKYLE